MAALIVLSLTYLFVSDGSRFGLDGFIICIHCVYGHLSGAAS